MKIRFRIRKGPPVRWLSHLDLSRAWMRAMIRAELPLEYSEGYNPHPKLAFSPALPVGIVGESEYVDVAFSETVEAASAIERLNAAVPPGLEATGGIPLPTGRKVPSLAGSVTAADYRIVIEGITPAEMDQALTEYDITVKKMDGERKAPVLIDLEAGDGRTRAVIRVPMCVRPLTIFAGIQNLDRDTLLSRAQIDRIALWEIINGRLVDPLAAVGCSR